MSFEQGDIVALDFSPTQGHEQSGYRPSLVVSRNVYNAKTGFIVVCPITNTLKPFPTRISLDYRTLTTGFVICEQVRTIDVNARTPKFIERMPDDLFRQALDIVTSIFEGAQNA
ncbi:MAG: type II toxin-antitoxin system PemK/MazF family toxin [Clostridiales bacterium]|nr:type II toxin-antitoxin system PemK/MazF family toxin [Clostridiales bacterium]